MRQHGYFNLHDIKDIDTAIDIFYFHCCQYRDYEIGRFLLAPLLGEKICSVGKHLKRILQ